MQHAVRPRPGDAPARERRLGEGDARVPRAAAAATARRSASTDVEKRIRFEKIVTPADWETRYAVYRGATFNLAHTWAQMLHLRPRNRFEDLDGVYLVGGGTHPGSGLPVIYESARITQPAAARRTSAATSTGSASPARRSRLSRPSE